MARKKNVRLIPKHVFNKISRIESSEIVVGAAKVFKAAELKEGILSHLNINLTSNGLTFPNEIIPPSNIGKFSTRNREGYIVKRKDLGKQTIGYRTAEVPNWGDSWKGTHPVDLPIKGYPKEQIAPTFYPIKIDCLNKKPQQQRYVIKFEIGNILNKKSSSFNDELLYCLNILQENVGVCDVEKAGTKLSDYLKTLRVSWEILPPDKTGEALKLIFKGRKPSRKQVEDTKERLQFFKSLKPQKTIVGSSGFSRYFGALINKNLVVFDNMDYGNAVYIMFKKWEELSQKTRKELLSGIYGNDFERIVHDEGWQDKVKKIIKVKRRI